MKKPRLVILLSAAAALAACASAPAVSVPAEGAPQPAAVLPVPEAVQAAAKPAPAVPEAPPPAAVPPAEPPAAVIPPPAEPPAAEPPPPEPLAAAAVPPAETPSVTDFRFAANAALGRRQRRAERIRRAEHPPEKEALEFLVRAYPGNVGGPIKEGGDWYVFVRGKKIYYAGGRLLSEDQRAAVTEYTPWPMYLYPAALGEWEQPDSAQAAELARLYDRPPEKRSMAFFDALYGGGSKEEIKAQLIGITFLGLHIPVHRDITAPLDRVERKILAAARGGGEVARWIQNLRRDGTISWKWRDIEGSAIRSFHAYGVALDLLPKSLDGYQAYWRWTVERDTSWLKKRRDWYNTPYGHRYHPPEAVVEAFESEGFVWGGKWEEFDTMHFEYRPEILLVNDMEG